MRFPVIVADPPWSYKCWSTPTPYDRRDIKHGSSRVASAFYDTQETDWLAKLPVADVAAPDCCLFLWATWPNLLDAIRIIEAWSFTYKTLAFDWVKVSGDGNPLFRLGYWTRANSEPCLLATRGKPKRMDKGVGQVLVSGVGEHSEKPEEMYERIERLVEGPYLELFHRPRNGLFPPRAGWTFAGLEVDGQDMADALRALGVEEPPEPPYRDLAAAKQLARKVRGR